MDSITIADHLTSDISFMLDHKKIFNDINFNLWYDEIDFDIKEVAKEVISKFPNSRLLEVYHDGFKFKWNKYIIYIKNFDEYN